MKTVRVVAAIIRKDNKIFATQRGYGDFKDGWEFPGGKIEEGESPEHAIAREIKEELNADIIVGDLLTTVEYDYPKFHLFMDCFWAELAPDSHMKLLEHEAAKWLSIDEIDSVDWLPADVEVVKMIKENYLDSLKNELFRMNVHSKEVLNPVENDYCQDKRILPAVKGLYYKNKLQCDRFINPYGLPFFDPDDRRYYVYAWHTNTDPKMYFYVGKGTRDRYKHILYEIKDYRTGKKKANPRYKWFSYLQDKYGIDCEISLSGLSNYESIIYEQALKIQFSNNGEVLLNVEGIPTDQLPEGWQDRHAEKKPLIENSNLYRRYYDYEDIPSFDIVNIDCLSKVFFYPYGLGRDKDVEIEETLIKQWLNDTSGKLYTSGTAKGVDSIIVFRYLSEERYRAFKALGKRIFSSSDVVAFLNLSGE